MLTEMREETKNLISLGTQRTISEIKEETKNQSI
jgi:hypothetical protein